MSLESVNIPLSYTFLSYAFISAKGEELDAAYRGTTKVLSAPMDHINLHVRGGFIIPTQEPARTTVQRWVIE